MRWGFMNSVQTDPKESLLPYSTRVSSPALKIMHTWGRMEALWREVGEGHCSSGDLSLSFPVSSPPFTCSLPIPCHSPLWLEAGMGLIEMGTGNRGYSHSHFQRNISHCHQNAARLSAKWGENVRDDVDNYTRQGWRMSVARKRDDVQWGFDVTQKVLYQTLALILLFPRETAAKTSLTVEVYIPGNNIRMVSFGESYFLGPCVFSISKPRHPITHPSSLGSYLTEAVSVQVSRAAACPMCGSPSTVPSPGSSPLLPHSHSGTWAPPWSLKTGSSLSPGKGPVQPISLSRRRRGGKVLWPLTQLQDTLFLPRPKMLLIRTSFASTQGFAT